MYRMIPLKTPSGLRSRIIINRTLHEDTPIHHPTAFQTHILSEIQEMAYPIHP